MPIRKDIKRVMVIGSGPIIIGQAAEFDYAGTQACKSLREEDIEVVLVNSNPATIMTDTDIADVVYIEPISIDFITEIIRQERPDGLLPTLGGQTGLNMAVSLADEGVLERFDVELLGTPLETIRNAEDREMFGALMQKIKQPMLESAIIVDIESGMKFAEKYGYPVIVRPAFTLGGTGGGVAKDPEQLENTLRKGLKMSMIHQCLIEKCVLGWREIEYEVMRDGADNCFIVCNMENIDPMGVHTGDSIVVAPSQTLTDREYQMLRTSSLDIISALGIEGGCNVQYALDTDSLDYYVIEVNPRVSRSSALASKATGYPIAKIASKIAVGLTLDEIVNPVTQKTYASFEPALDYVVIKIPRWPFDKFDFADRSLGTQMKATGEVMSIGRNFESALLKAIRSLETGCTDMQLKDKNLGLLSDMQIESYLQTANDERLFVVMEAFRQGMTVTEIANLTRIDPWFLDKIRNLVLLEAEIKNMGGPDSLTREDLKKYKDAGFSDPYMAGLMGCSVAEIEDARKRFEIDPVFKMVDTCAGEFEAETPYYYSAYEKVSEVKEGKKRKIAVLGSGPIRIGQGIEFDYCSVHSVFALKEEGIDSIIINNNPETVSTDFDTSDRLYFEPLTKEDVMSILREEGSEGVIVQFGGQTAINLAEPLHKEGIKIIGTPFKSIEMAEDRGLFDKLLSDLDIPRPRGKAVVSMDQAVKAAGEIGYPVLVRPSFVLGGRAMEIVYDREHLEKYFASALLVNPEHPVLVDEYVLGRELEVDVIGDGKDFLIPGIMEHIERAGVHSGDSMAVYPPQTIGETAIKKVVDYSGKISEAMNVYGLMNIQYVARGNDIFVIEVNPRASRTIPYLSKITGIPMVKAATKAMLGRTLKEQGLPTGLPQPARHIAVKSPVFSFAKMMDVDVSLGPEMKSTGEVMGIDYSYDRALYKAMLSAGIKIPPTDGHMLVTIADKDKDEALELLERFGKLGYTFSATPGTSAFLESRGFEIMRVEKIGEGRPDIIDHIYSGEVDLLLNTLTPDPEVEKDGQKIRRSTVELDIPCMTSLDTALALLLALEGYRAAGGRSFSFFPVNHYMRDAETARKIAEWQPKYTE